MPYFVRQETESKSFVFTENRAPAQHIIAWSNDLDESEKKVSQLRQNTDV